MLEKNELLRKMDAFGIGSFPTDDRSLAFLNSLLNEERKKTVQWIPQFEAISPTQESLALQFCAEISGNKGCSPLFPDPVRLLEMAQALYLAEYDFTQQDNSSDVIAFSDLSTPLISLRLYENLQFLVSARIDDAVVYFEIFNVFGTNSDGQPLFESKHTDVSIDHVSDFTQATIFLSGSIKWDGCSNWKFDEQDHVLIHGCSKEDLTRIGTIMGECWDWASKILPSWSA